MLLHCPHLSGLDFSKNCVFSVLGKEFFSRHILSKNLNWESGVIWKCGPTRLIFAQVLVHSQLIWHWSWSPHVPVLDLVPDIVVCSVVLCPARDEAITLLLL